MRGRTADLGEALAEEEALITVETMQDQRWVMHRPLSSIQLAVANS